MYTCDALETIQSKTLLHTFAPNYTVLWRLKRNFLFPHTPLVISSFNRYHWPKIIISMPFDSSNQLYFVVLVFLWAYMRHVELFLHTGGDPYALRPPIVSITRTQNTHITQRPLFSGIFFCGEITQRPLHFKDTHVATHRTIWTNLHAYTQIPLFLPVPSLRILGVCECQSHPIINMINTPLPAYIK